MYNSLHTHSCTHLTNSHIYKGTHIHRPAPLRLTYIWEDTHVGTNTHNHLRKEVMSEGDSEVIGRFTAACIPAGAITRPFKAVSMFALQHRKGRVDVHQAVQSGSTSANKHHVTDRLRNMRRRGTKGWIFQAKLQLTLLKSKINFT